MYGGEAITILGCGTMGTAVLNSLLEAPNVNPQAIYTITGSKESQLALKDKYGDKIVSEKNPLSAISNSQYVVIGLKPYNCRHVLDKYRAELADKVLISLVAGWTVSQLSEYSPNVVRIMTNTPAKFGYGMAAVSMSDAGFKDDVEYLFGGIGKFIFVSDSKMDSATSLIGSGPAFVLLMMESMIDSGIKLGFTYEESRKSVLQVLEGTTKMVEATNLHPAVLKAQVCTPGGTTINGLAKMEEKGLRTAIIQGVQEAKDIASGLGK